MKSIIIVHGPRASGKSFVAAALADRNRSVGDKDVIVTEVSSLSDVAHVIPSIPPESVGIFVCAPNFVFDPEDVRPPLPLHVSTFKVYINHFVG